MTTAYIGLGSNVGDRVAHLRAALEALAARGVTVTKVSSLYETDPVGPPQPDFLNAAAEVSTDLPPADLVRALKAAEADAGREQRERWGPREVDLDLLLYGDEMIDEEGLTVPHPELTHRAFVLVPLIEIAPFLDLPSGEPLTAFCEKDPAGVRRFPTDNWPAGEA
ncbi:MAG: 2-amino-4-hydroxy-6-hydroxymethyldihydropteridine diphosphokinase [Actinomycetota bacterium]